MLLAGLIALRCRPGLEVKTRVGGLLFILFCAVGLIPLSLLAPGYIERVCRLSAIPGHEKVEVRLRFGRAGKR